MTTEERNEERLQKVLATAGVASRRRSEELILAGRVTVNGKKVTVSAGSTTVDLVWAAVGAERAWTASGTACSSGRAAGTAS